ncbi:MAG: hypothetical protein KKF80_06625, partial [Candidatus Omnitrophica bacterium]|nr:hypothetical protein [Candidatus Omnitrophota bacterium]
MKKIIVIFFVAMMVSVCGFARNGNGSPASVDDELSGLLDDFNSLKEELAAARDDYRNLTSEYMQASVDAQAQLAAAAAERAALSAQLAQAHAARETLKLRYEQAQSSIAEKEGFINETERARQKLANQLKDIEDKFSQTQASGDRARAQLQQTASDLTNKEKNLAEIENTRQQLNMNLKETEARLAQIVSEKAAIVTQLAAYKAKESGWQQRAGQLAGVIAEKEKAIINATGAANQVSVKLKDYEAKLAALESQKTVLEKRVQESQAREQALEAQAQQAGANLQGNEKTLNELTQAKQQLLVQAQELQSRLAATLQEKDKALAELATTREQLLAQTKELETKSAAVQSEKASLNSQLAAYKAKETGWQQRANQFAETIAEKEKAIADLAAAGKQASAKLKEYDEKIAGLESQKAALEAAAKGLQTQGQSARVQLEQTAAALQEKDKALVELTKAKEQFLVQIKELETKSAALQLDKTNLDGQLAAYKAKESGWQQRSQQLAMEAKDLEAKFSQVSSEKSALLPQLAAYKTKEAGWQQRSQQLTELVSEKEKGIAQLTQSENNNNNLIKEYEARITILNQQRMALETQIKNMKAKVDSFDAQLGQMVAAGQEKEREFAQLEHTRQQLVAQAKDLGSSLAQTLSEKTALTGQLNGYKIKEAGWQVRSQQLASDIADKEKTIEALTQTGTQTAATLRDYETKIVALESQRAALESKMQDAQTQQESLRVQFGEATRVLQGRDKALMELAKAKEQLLGQIKELEAKSGTLQIDKESLDGQLAAYKTKEAGWQQRAGQLAGVIAEKEKAIIQLSQEKTQILTQLRETREKYAQEVSAREALRKQFDELSEKEKALRAQTASEKGSLEAQLNAYTTKEAGWQVRSGQLSTAITDRDKNIAELKQTVYQNAIQLKDYEAQSAALQLEKAALATQFKELQLREQAAQMTAQQAAASLQEKEKTIAGLAQSHQITAIQLKGFEAQLAHAANEKSELQKQLVQCAATMGDKAKIISGLTEDFKHSSMQVRESEIKMAQLRSERAGLQNQFTQINDLL